MNLAWLKDHVKTMAELAKYTEPDEEVKSSSVWELVEKEQNRRCDYLLESDFGISFTNIIIWHILYTSYFWVNVNISKLEERGAGPVEEAAEANRRAAEADWGHVEEDRVYCHAGCVKISLLL